MKTEHPLKTGIASAALAAGMIFNLHAVLFPTAITYQGQLTDGGAPANGNYDFSFKVYDDPGSGTQQGVAFATNALPVSNGLFTLTLDFGTNVFTGGPRWLDIWVHNSTNAPGVGWVWLSPRQPLTAAPYALYAPSAGNAATAMNLSGTVSDAQIPATVARLNSSPVFTGSVSAGGDVLGSRLNIGQNNQLAGVSATIAGGGNNVVGANSAYGAIGGGSANQILPSTFYGTIAGGINNLIGTNSDSAAVGGGSANHVLFSSYYATIGGGVGNIVSAERSTIGGGDNNQATNTWATVGGGDYNVAGGSRSLVGGGRGNLANGEQAVVGGGSYNMAIGNQSTIGGGTMNYALSYLTTVGGGQQNVANGAEASVGGGSLNLAGGYGAVVAGGTTNRATGDFSTIAGGAANAVTNAGDTISGGTGNTATGGNATIAGGQINRAEGLTSTVGGGYENQALEWDSTVSGGAANTAAGVSSTIAGGTYNTADNYWGTIGGGKANYAGYIATIPGGLQNYADHMGAIGGGYGNIVNGWCGAVPGGYTNHADGAYSFAAGRRAKAVHDGAFVWADTTDADFASTGTNQFLIRAVGGVGINTAPGSSYTLDVQASQSIVRFTSATSANGSVLEFKSSGFGSNVNNLGVIQFNDGLGRFPGQIAYTGLDTMKFRVGGDDNSMLLDSSGLRVHGTFVSSSDRNEKEHFLPVSAQAVLDKVAALPISRWNYKFAPGAEHIGPMAQDFHAAFGVGPDDKHIATVDEGGVALAAIQGLNEKVESGKQKAESRMERLEAENAELRTRLEKLERLLTERNGGAQ